MYYSAIIVNIIEAMRNTGRNPSLTGLIAPTIWELIQLPGAELFLSQYKDAH